jgi:S1-C subfamily serine protease
MFSLLQFFYFFHQCYLLLSVPISGSLSPCPKRQVTSLTGFRTFEPRKKVLMEKNIFTELSGELEHMVKRAAAGLVHIGGEDLPFRTGVVWDSRLILTTALSAEAGEAVAYLGVDGKPGEATVKGFDGRTGLVLLETKTDLSAPAWKGEAPRLGALAANVAFPSPAGPEAVLSMARIVADDYFQTDSAPFPGFSGAAVIGPGGALWGVVTSNAAGNRGQAIPYPAIAALVADLKGAGSRQRRVLGVRTQPVEAGLLVVEVCAESAALTAGLLVGDILVKAGEVELKTPFDLLAALEKCSGKLALTVSRGGQTMTIEVEPHLEPETTAHRWKHGSCCGR